jgi:DNA-binding MarR family transcriptional regulator
MLMDEVGQVKYLDEFLRLVPLFFKRLAHSLPPADEASTHRFTHAQFRVLELTSHKPHWRMSDLAHRMALSPGSLTLMMDRLIEDGLISRGRSQEDRRVVIVQVTDKGRSMLAERRRALHEIVAAEITKLPLQQRDELAAAMGTIVRFLERYVVK